jgi:hypothetical protein
MKARVFAIGFVLFLSDVQAQTSAIASPGPASIRNGTISGPTPFNVERLYELDSPVPLLPSVRGASNSRGFAPAVMVEGKAKDRGGA